MSSTTLDAIADSSVGQRLSPVSWKFLSCIKRLTLTSGTPEVVFASNARAAKEAQIHPASVAAALQQLTEAALATYYFEEPRNPGDPRRLHVLLRSRPDSDEDAEL